MNSSKFLSTKVLSTKVRICWNVFYQSPFYQSPVLPKSCWLQNDILLNSFLPKSGLLKNGILPNSVLPKSVPPVRGDLSAGGAHKMVCLLIGLNCPHLYSTQTDLFLTSSTPNEQQGTIHRLRGSRPSYPK
jgi:hypothetical protein